MGHQEGHLVRERGRVELVLQLGESVDALRGEKKKREEIEREKRKG